MKTARRLVVATLLLTGWTATALAAAPAWPDLSADAPAQAPAAGDAAVIVGIGDYAFVPDVPGAVDNARDWYAWLTRSRQVPVDRVFLLRDHEGTREKMLRVAGQAAEAVKRGGTLWFVFVGHGAPGHKGDDGVLVGVDAQQEAESLYARALPQKELLAALEQGRQARTVMVVDACFSGRTAGGAPLAPGLQPLIAVDIPRDAQQGLVLFSAGASDQFAGPLPGVARPAMSYLLLGALRGWADGDADGAVSADEAIAYVKRAITATVKDRVQTPALVTSDAAAVLASGAMQRGPDLVSVVLGEPERPREIGPQPTKPAGTVAAEAEVEDPVYEKWWFWAIVGGVVAGGVITAVILSDQAKTADTTATATGTSGGLAAQPMPGAGFRFDF